MQRIIWTNDLNYDDWKDDLKDQYPDLTENQLIDLMYELNDEYFIDEQEMLDKQLGGDILVFGTLGLWNGTKTGYKIIKENNLNAIMEGHFCDTLTWYVEGKEVKCKDVHHDGANYYTYRELTIDSYDFEEYVWEHTLQEAIEKYSKPLGHYVAEIYGFELEEKI